jgi:hypothetical protein
MHIIGEALQVHLDITTTTRDANFTAAAVAMSLVNLGDARHGRTSITVFVPSHDTFAAIGSILGNISTEMLQMCCYTGLRKTRLRSAPTSGRYAPWNLSLGRT